MNKVTNDPDPRRLGIVTFLTLPERFFLVMGLLTSLSFAILFPPFSIADEPNHFYRAYAVSLGELGASLQAGGAGVIVPASLPIMVRRLRGGYPPHRGWSARVIASALWWRLVPDKMRFVDCRTADQFTFVAYLPQAAAIAVGRAIGAPPLLVFYLARLGNLIVGLLLTYWAILLMPTYRWLFAMIALTPMAVCERASVSADSLTNAAAFVFIAAFARLAFGSIDTIWQRDFAWCCLSSVLLSLVKPPYFLLTSAVLLIPKARIPGTRRATAITAYVLILAIAIGYNLWIATSVDVPLREGPDPTRQIQAMFLHPLHFLALVFADYFKHCPRYGAQVIGIELGWLDTHLPIVLVGGYLLVLLTLVIVDTNRSVHIELSSRVSLAAIVLSILVLISASQYSVWTPFGANFIEGIQGRYFIPILPIGALIFHSARYGGRFMLPQSGFLLAAFSAVVYGVASFTVVNHFYGA